MTKLSDTQLVILTAACQRPGRLVLPLPAHLKGGDADKVIGSLTAKGLIKEEPAMLGDPVWRGDETLVATDAAFAALGIEEDVGPAGADGASEGEPATDMAAEPKTPPTGADAAPEAKPVRKTRSGTKQDALIAMLRRPEGASIEEIAAAFAWQKHTIRAAISVAVKKKLGLDVTSEKVDGRGRVYRAR